MPDTELMRQQMSAAEYFATPGLSNSAMKDLEISPLRYWYRHLNPDRPPDEETPEMRIGSALHCAVLEPKELDKRYACEISPEDVPGVLVTINEIRAWLLERGIKAKGTLKAEVIAQAQAYDAEAPILDVLIAQHLEKHAGKTILTKDEYLRVTRAAGALLEEPKLQQLLSVGDPEVEVFAKDPETGVQLKARMDWVAPNLILDLKTFSQREGKTIDKSISDAIYFQKYYRTAYFYSLMRGWPKWDGQFIIPFVESTEPYEVRIRALRPKFGGDVNIWWERARLECRALIRTYADYMERFGDKPWWEPQQITELEDREMPGMAFDR